MRILQNWMEWVRKNPALFVIFVVGAAVRCIAIGHIPPGLNQDEASIGYDAYSLLHYGIDRNGSPLPVHLIAWGSGQNALYAYLSIPFIYLFGLNVVSVRIVSLLFGLLGMLLFYQIVRKMFDSQRAALLGAFLIAINPWQIMMSRWALESNLFPTLVLLAVWCLLRSLDRGRLAWLFGFTVALGLSLYAYGTAYFFVPLFAAGVYALLLAKRLAPWRIIMGQGLLLVVLALPIALFVLINRYDWPAIKLWPFTIPKLTVPRVEEVSSVFGGEGLNGLLRRFFRLFELLLSQSDGLIWNAISGFGFMYILGLPLVVIGLLWLAKQLIVHRMFPSAVIALWLTVAGMMALITDININRMNIIFYPLILLAVAGLHGLGGKVKALSAVAVGVLAVSFLAFTINYYTVFPDKISARFYESFGDAIQYASDVTDGQIHITNTVNMPYIYVLFYEQIDPRNYLDTVEYHNPGGAFQQVKAFDRYTFGAHVMRDGEDMAYIFPNTAVPSLEGLEMQVKRFKHYTVISSLK